jgi:hypothetical protein
MASTWRDRAAVTALAAGAVAVVVLVVEGPPGSGYGWGSVAVSAGIVGALFAAMAYLVRCETPGRALASAVLAAVTILMFGASLIGNWSGQSAGARALDVISTLAAVTASGMVLVVASATVRHPGTPRSHAAR